MDEEIGIQRDVSGNPFYYKNFSSRTKLIIGLCGIVFLLINVFLFRLIFLLSRPRLEPNKKHTKPPNYPTHLLIVLGSGGHTTEMFDMLRRLPLSPTVYQHRTYIVSSGDSFSALKAAEFESKLLGTEASEKQADYTIVTITRARRIHQSLISAPFSVVRCLWDCLRLLRNQHPDQALAKRVDYPDLVLTNGPGTGVCVIIACLTLRFFGFSGPFRPTKDRPVHAAEMRTIFVESWARVNTLSLSGKILLPLVDRFLVQWPALDKRGEKAEYVGTLVA